MSTTGIRRLQVAATGDPLLFLIFCGDAFPAQRAAILEAVGPKVHVLATDSTHPDPSREDLAKAAGAPFGELALSGFSAGCHGVRNLLGPLAPEVVITADGTHASMPGRPATMPLEPWVKLAAEAKAGKRLWCASHSNLTYVEQLKPPDGPYYSTVTTLRLATGWELPEPAGAGEHTTREEGDLVVESYESGPASPEAHIRQCREVLPRMLSTYVRPRWNPLHIPSFVDLGRMIVDAIRGSLFGEGLGARALHIASAEIGVHETRGPENTARVLEYLRGCERNGKALGLASDEFEWCAAFASWSAFTARRPGEVVPHAWRAAVAELASDARASGALRLAGAGYDPKPGDLALFGRNGEDPLRGGHGHVVRLLDRDAGNFHSIGGNEGASGIVQVSPHVMSDPLLKAWVDYPT